MNHMTATNFDRLLLALLLFVDWLGRFVLPFSSNLIDFFVLFF